MVSRAIFFMLSFFVCKSRSIACFFKGRFFVGLYCARSYELVSLLANCVADSGFTFFCDGVVVVCFVD